MSDPLKSTETLIHSSKSGRTATGSTNMLNPDGLVVVWAGVVGESVVLGEMDITGQYTR